MAFRDLLPALFTHPFIMLFLVILGLILLIVPILILWQLGILTGIIFAIIVLAIGYALHSMGLIDVKKYPLLGPIFIVLTFGAFFIGVISERTGAFLVTPLLQKPTPITPLLTEPPEAFISGNIEVFLVFILLLAILLGWAGKRGS